MNLIGFQIVIEPRSARILAMWEFVRSILSDYFRSMVIQIRKRGGISSDVIGLRMIGNAVVELSD
ncbi:MAG: hypothetical protein ACRECH_05505 [Nitrososphaerales archaeon]